MRCRAIAKAYVKRVALRYTFGCPIRPLVGFCLWGHPMPKSSLLRVFGVILLIAIAGVAVFFWLRFTPGRTEAGCNLHERRCIAQVPGGGTVTLGVEPRPFELGRPWKLSLAIDGISADKAEIDFAGLTLQTSFNRVVLTSVAPGRFEGEGTIPTCTFEPSTWQATVLVKSGDRNLSIPFVFSSDPSVTPTVEPRKELAVAPGGGGSMLRGAGGAFGAQQIRGFVAVLFFGYTQAPPTCSQPLAVIDGALAKLSADERARVLAVMVALDPQGDAPERLQPQLQARFLGYRVATGADADLIGAARLYGAAFSRRAPGPDGKPRIDHSAVFSILDPTGRLVGQLASQDSDKLAAELRKALGTATPAPAPAPK